MKIMFRTNDAYVCANCNLHNKTLLMPGIILKMQGDPTRKAANKIASGLYLLEREPILKADERLVKAYYEMTDSWSYDAFEVQVLLPMILHLDPMIAESQG
jgi:hypothetical protein